jgi:S1-C subfamily serine protease
MNRFVLQSPDGDFTTITSLEEVKDGIKVSIEYRASFIGEMEVAAKENMLFGTGQFLENLKSVYETGEDIRNTLWRTWIGIGHATDQSSRGTKVLQVKDGSNAARAGIVAGDVITGIEGQSVSGYESFERLLNTKEVNSSVTITVIRGEEHLDIVCEVGEYPVAY